MKVWRGGVRAASESSPGARAAAPHALYLLPALLLSAAIHARALGTFFAQDDVTFLSRAAGLEPANWLFRPLSEGLAFRVQHALFGLEPLGYHAVNLALHLVNVAAVYALGLKLVGGRAAAGAAALLFGTSSIAFTPLHWATGIVELLTGSLLLGATLLHLESHRRGAAWRWGAALVALAAMASKETAAAWVLVVALIERRAGRAATFGRAVLPAALASVLFGIAFLATGLPQRFEGSEAYARTTSPLFLALNLLTYASWCVTLAEPIPDRIARVDPGAWRMALPVFLALGLTLRLLRRDARQPVVAGMGWWLAFLLPVLPLMHHTYFYYLYVPWVGGAIALSALGRALLTRWPRRWAALLAALALGGFALIEARNVQRRATETLADLPADRTIRESMLLARALPTLRVLPAGTRVLFVNPVPGPRFDLTTGAPTREEHLYERMSYLPLEAALRGGETLRLFAPQVHYLGFTTTIPPGLEDAECFHFEHRGWLEPWGRGVEALTRQAQVQDAAGRWAAADSTRLRVQALGGEAP